VQKIRVIQWTTGNVGKIALRAILEDPRLQLVGVYAHSADKSGLDAGSLCGRPDTGIFATNDIEALVALGAKMVIYTPFQENLAEVVRLLETGHDVISSNLFHHLGGITGEVRARLEQACLRGDSSLYISGINPGWVNSVATALTAVCRRVDSVLISESADCSVYESPETWNALGIGAPGVTPQIREAALQWMVMFRDVVARVADALDFELDEDIEFAVDYATAAETVDLGWFHIEKGTNAACRASWFGKVEGRTVVQVRVTWYLTDKLVEDWDIIRDEYQLVIKGDPGLEARIRLETPDYWTNAEHMMTTALPMVNAIVDVHAAPAGILGILDVGLPHAPAGLWNSRHASTAGQSTKVLTQ
jgi:hypothetical protein